MPQLSFLSHTDASDEFTYCVPVSQVTQVTRLIYFGLKLFRAVLKAPAPPPP